ncbi:hypothetical protein D8674_037039 [Pyrus ussuriensis x Pyrus communis]|uniref:Uncharacterized protein n=1 Tax=Pyrus ussuriensis x Pyrus communis TaxID=2448454 RepID=A0A5N5GWT3_9ROSA|nr:hypothetical protein D8674_037039 [Pyrus ussuriensis x Pyrus communis]
MYKFLASRFCEFSLTYIKDENDDDRRKAESKLSLPAAWPFTSIGGGDGRGSSEKRGLEGETMARDWRFDSQMEASMTQMEA